MIAARDNPFAPCRLERVLGFDPQLSGTSWEALERRWEEQGWRGAITGRFGAGKSTLLRTWEQRLIEQSERPLRLFFNREARTLSAEERAEVEALGARPLLVDGWDYLSLQDRRFLAGHAPRRLVTRHWRGWRPLIYLRPHSAMAEELLHRAAPEHAGAFVPGLRRDLARHRGNLRAVWMDCYARMAGSAD